MNFELNEYYWLLYKHLRQAGLIGKLWVSESHYKLAPLDALPGFEHVLAEFISRDNLQILLDSMFPLVRKPPVSSLSYEDLYPTPLVYKKSA